MLELNSDMRISDIIKSPYKGDLKMSTILQAPQIPAPIFSAKKFNKIAREQPIYSGYHGGSMPASQFMKYNIENWNRNEDPRYQEVAKTIAQGVREPIQLGQPGKDRVAVIDGGHRVTAAVKYYLETGKDVEIPYLYHSRKEPNPTTENELLKPVKTKADGYNRVGLDLDGTLLNGPHHKDIERWLSTTRAEVQIITFRHDISPKLGRFLQQFSAISTVHTLPRGIEEGSKEYLKWKGKICKQMSIPVLIDDDIRSVKKGCEKYGIKLIDANQWLSESK
jgi:hypothetical protein